MTDFCLSAGGDVVTRGRALPGRWWRVGIQHPHDRLALAAVVRAGDLAIATSAAAPVRVRRIRRRMPARQRPFVVDALAALAGLGLGITLALGVAAESAGSLHAEGGLATALGR